MIQRSGPASSTAGRSVARPVAQLERQIARQVVAHVRAVEEAAAARPLGQPRGQAGQHARPAHRTAGLERVRRPSLPSSTGAPSRSAGHHDQQLRPGRRLHEDRDPDVMARGQGLQDVQARGADGRLGVSPAAADLPLATGRTARRAAGASCSALAAVDADRDLSPAVTGLTGGWAASRGSSARAGPDRAAAQAHPPRHRADVAGLVAHGELGEVDAGRRGGPADRAVSLAAHLPFTMEELAQRLGFADADPLDVLLRLAYGMPLRTRSDRLAQFTRSQQAFLNGFAPEARRILEMILDKYAEHGPGDLDPGSWRFRPCRTKAAWSRSPPGSVDRTRCGQRWTS